MIKIIGIYSITNTLKFYTMKEAVKWAGLKDGSSIGKACRGITKTAGKHPQTKEPLSWKYRDDLK